MPQTAIIASMKYALLLFVLLFASCSMKSYQHTQIKLVTIKSQKLKFSDVAYLRSGQDGLELELFVAGKSIEKIAIDTLICTKSGCMSKSGFNSEYLNDSYDKDTLESILQGRAIFGSDGVVKNENSFSQNIADREIVYEVKQGSIVFRDNKNHIFISIKDIDE